MRADLQKHVNTCDSCQRAQNQKPYHKSLYYPQISVFNVFSLDFADPFPVTKCRNRFLLVYIEHLTGWPIFMGTEKATAEVAVFFLISKVLLPFGTPGVNMSDNTACSTAQVVQKLLKRYGPSRRTVSAYAPMSNEHAE